MSNDNSIYPVTFTAPVVLLPHRSVRLAFAEGAALLGGLAFLDYSGLLPFATWPVHPFIFAVTLLSAQYGLQAGILAALGAIGLSHLAGWPARPIDMGHAEYFRIVWADSLSWLLAALMVGIVTSHRASVLAEQSAKLRKATMAESLISAQYQVLAQRTHMLERSVAGLTRSYVEDVAPPTEVATQPEPAARINKARQRRG